MWFFQPFNEVNQTVRKGKRYEKISAADTFWIFLLYLSKVHKENIQCSHLQLTSPIHSTNTRNTISQRQTLKETK